VTFISFAQTLFGILFVIRTLQIFRARAMLTQPFVTKTGTIFVTIALLSAFLSVQHAIFATLLSFANIFVAFATLFVCERRQIDALKAEFPFFLDRWILNLRLGSALTPSREQALRDHSANFQTLLRPLFNSSGLSAAKLTHPLLPSAQLHELERIQREPHAALQRLENLRHTIRKTAEFRRKSGQAVQQTRIQSSVMLLMLVALIAFTLRRYGWSRVADLVAESVVLSLIGTLTMHLLTRKTRWKI
jgi:hypothetical protein